MRKTTSLKIDPEIWKKAKKKCIDKDLSISSYLETLIKKDIKLILFLVLVTLVSLKINLELPFFLIAFVNNSNKEKMSEAKIGKKNPFYGKKHSEETKKIISRKIKKAFKEKTKEKINTGTFKKGNIPWNKGTKGLIKGWNKGLTKETSKKVKKAAELRKKTAFERVKGKTWEEIFGKQRALEIKKKLSLACKGKVITPETREKISSTLKKHHPGRGKPISEEVKEKIRNSLKNHPMLWKKERIEKIKAARAKQKLPKENSSIELKIQDFLKKLGVDFYTHQYVREIEHKYRCDIFIPKAKLIIETDGDYFHGNPKFYSQEELTQKQIEQKQRDQIRTEELIESGFKILRLWESEIKEMTIRDFKNKIRGMAIWN